GVVALIIRARSGRAGLWSTGHSVGGLFFDRHSEERVRRVIPHFTRAVVEAGAGRQAPGGRRRAGGESRQGDADGRQTRHQPTAFERVPTGGMVIEISAPDFKVNESGGTMPVPVNRKQPVGKLQL